MSISPTDKISGLTNAQAGLLRDELLALLQAAGMADPTVRQTKRRLRMGIDLADDQADARTEAAAVDADNLRRQAHDRTLEPIRRRRQARASTDYGED
jgi:hypothetical protein